MKIFVIDFLSEKEKYEKYGKYKKLYIKNCFFIVNNDKY